MVALGAAVLLARRTVPRGAVVAICAAVVGLLILPATFLQVGLRDATEPWYHVNDSTYQIEIAGDLILDGENPYGHDYRDSGLRRWYRPPSRSGIRRSRSTTSRTSPEPR